MRMVRVACGRMEVRRLAHCGLGWLRKEHCLRSPRQKGQVPRRTSHPSSGNTGCSHLLTDQSNKTDTPNLVLSTFAYFGKKKIEREAAPTHESKVAGGTLPRTPQSVEREGTEDKDDFWSIYLR